MWIKMKLHNHGHATVECSYAIHDGRHSRLLDRMKKKDIFYSKAEPNRL